MPRYLQPWVHTLVIFHVPIIPEDKQKTSFVYHAVEYKYNWIQFGLTKARGTFQRALDLIHTDLKWETCLIYLDDVIIYSKTVDEHITHMDEIRSCIKAAGVISKINNWHFVKSTVKYLVHVIKPGKLEIDLTNTESLLQARTSTSKTELRPFLGLRNFYRRFITRSQTQNRNSTISWKISTYTR